MQTVPTRVSFVDKRQESYSHTVLSQHLINTPKIVRFLYRGSKEPKEVKALPQSDKQQHPIKSTKDDSCRLRKDKPSRKSVLVERDITFGSLQPQASSKFSLHTKQFKPNDQNMQRSGTQSQAEPKVPIEFVESVSLNNCNSLQQANRRLPVNHILCQVPVSCDFFGCVAEQPRKGTLGAEDRQRREKIFSHLLKQSQEYAIGQNSHKKASQRSKASKVSHFQARGERGLKQLQESMQEEQVPSYVLESWQSVEKERPKANFGRWGKLMF